MQKLEATSAVLAYFFPEVRSVLRVFEQQITDEAFLWTTPASVLAQKLGSLFSPALTIPIAKDGQIDYLGMQQSGFELIRHCYRPTIPALNTFPNVYLSSAATEGLFHLLVQLKKQGIRRIYTLAGEYEGYARLALNLGIRIKEIPIDAIKPRHLKPGIWFISNPSSTDGQILPNTLVTSLCEAGHRVVLDLSYVGTTAPHIFDVSHPNVIAAVLSFSKPYGVYRFRLGGFVFARTELPTLASNFWTKDTLRFFQALKLADAIGPARLYPLYRPKQETIVNLLNREFGLGMNTSDVMLLGRLPLQNAAGLSPSMQGMIQGYLRGAGYRFCLTPYFERQEQSHQSQHQD